MSDLNLARFKEILTSRGYRLTTVREQVFRLLASPEPQSMHEILTKASIHKIDRVSVYRNIELFEKLDIVRRIHIGWKYKLELSDNFMAHHHHLSCLGCGKVVDIQDEKHIDAFIDNVARSAGFTPRRHSFEIDGYCSECATAAAPVTIHTLH